MILCSMHIYRPNKKKADRANASILPLSACNKSQACISKDFLEGDVVSAGKNSSKLKTWRVAQCILSCTLKFGSVEWPELKTVLCRPQNI